MKYLPVLLTASVSTRGMVGALYSDEERERMYISTLKFYMDRFPQYCYVFVENSGWDLNRIRRSVFESTEEKENVEFISVNPNLCDISRGKGYNELILINDAVLRSCSIAESSAFFKVTGRYPIYNLGRFVDTAKSALEKGKSIYCDIKDHKIYDLLIPSWCGHSFDCRLFGCSVEFFFNQIMSKINLCDDYKGLILEDVLFKVVKESKDEISDRFDREPHIGGVAGHIGNSLIFTQSNDDLKSKIKLFIGNCIRIFLPWLKF